MLIDEILEQLRKPAKYGITADPKLRDTLRRAYVIRAQNVADYLYESSPKDEWNFESDFPEVAPPLPELWIEWRMSPRMNIGGNVTPNPGAGFVMGVLLGGVDLKALPRALPATGIRWLCSAYFFGRPPQESGIGRFGGLAWYVTDDGRLHRPQKKWLVISERGGEEAQLLTDFMSVSLYVPLLTLSFMHCKNVETVAGPAWSPKLQKARARRGKLPLVRWHTVVIEPVKKAVAAANGGDARLTPKALHICRGHWKNFQGKGLFGRHFGRYWWPEHRRGSLEQGLVLKDYMVKGGKGNEHAR